MQLSHSERQRIAAAVQAAEARAGVHISTAAVPASDRYAMYPLVWAALIALLIGGALALLMPAMGLREAFAIEASLFVMLSLVFEWRPIRLILVPRRIAHARASALAHREFAARILAHHGDRGGVLLFVSFGERYAEVIGDRITHARIGDEGWNKILAALVSAARSGRHADGIIAAVDECAAQLAAHPRP
jgi:putative membrane protein